MIIKDNVLPSLLLKSIQQRVSSDNFPWYISETASGEKSEFHRYSWSHSVYSNDGGCSSFMYDILYSCLLIGLDSIGVELNQLIRIRLGLLPQVTKNHINAPHVDYEIPHHNAIIYLTTCDGPTIIYDQEYDFNSGISSPDYVQTLGNLTIKHKCDSIENRICMFDGKYYHSSTMQTDTVRRIAVNYNFTVKS
jgi:hypothetical protein